MSQKNLIGLRCDSCGRAGYISHTNPKKQVQRKMEFKKFCDWCRKHTKHKEAKLPLKAAPKKKVPAPKKAPVVKTDKVAKTAKVAQAPATKVVKSTKPKEVKK